MKRRRNLIIGIVLSATAGFIALQSVNAPTPADEVIDTPSVVESEFPVTEIAPPTEESCYYVWAYRDAYDLTEKLDASLKAINPEVDINATLFGEDCIHADGRSTFRVMQTDFYFRLSVDNATNDTVLGNWMALVLEEIVQLPREEIQGNYGFVEFWFERGRTGTVLLRVPIEQYLDEAQGMRGAELFRKYYTQP
jgi:hypothetical protein